MKIGKDKILHIIAGAVIALVSLLLFGSSLIAFILALIAGGLKEYWDSKGHGCVELADFIATAIGGILVIGGYCLWYRFLN